ncbi:ABC transporter ATP-binding protein [Betaproteobacteria bacterium]|nr:ABC transporter ATP-binding protein [Betaproteobacteria bacterium]
MSDVLFSCKGLTMKFGGLTALNKLDLDIKHGDVLGLVGPNGSGKTTFFNVVTGIYRPTEGQVMFDGQDITGASPQTVFEAGIARTFQRSRLCLELSIFDNIMLGNKTRDLGFFSNIICRKAFHKTCAEDIEKAVALIRMLNPTLVDNIHRPVADLSMIDRRRVEICRALIGKPKLLFLDEPSAGMTHDETNQLMDEILAMKSDERKLTIVLIEHEMGIIGKVTTRCAVLNFGEKLCDGTYQSIVENPLVQEAYLGQEVTEDEG